jgi:endonuclease G
MSKSVCTTCHCIVTVLRFAMDIPADVERIARKRIADKQNEISRSLGYVAAGNPLASEQNTAPLVARLMAKNNLSREEAEAAAMGIRAAADTSPKQRAKIMAGVTDTGGAEAIFGQTIDFVGVAFFDRGRQAANAVARVAFRTGRGWGSGVKWLSASSSPTTM